MAHTNMSSSGLQEADIKTGCRNALNEASPATPTADSVFDRLKTLIERLTETRASNLDNLDKAITALESAIRGADNDTLKTISDQLDNVPSSSDYTSERASKLDNLDQAISTTESNIRGADNDDLKAISDQIDNLDTGVHFENVTDQALEVGATYTPAVDGYFTASLNTAYLNTLVTLLGDWFVISDSTRNWSGIGIANNIRFENDDSYNRRFRLDRLY